MGHLYARLLHSAMTSRGPVRGVLRLAWRRPSTTCLLGADYYSFPSPAGASATLAWRRLWWITSIPVPRESLEGVIGWRAKIHDHPPARLSYLQSQLWCIHKEPLAPRKGPAPWGLFHPPGPQPRKAEVSTGLPFGVRFRSLSAARLVPATIATASTKIPGP